ncbi:unnamed protein product, partial [Discosporangium mesarthrocarpum]
AASFALLVYVSAWLKCHYPDVFAAALLNSQPMGFYAPAQIVRDAREHGVTVHGPDINASAWDNRLEADGRASCALRLGLRQVKGMNELAGRALVEQRPQGGYVSVVDAWRRSGTGTAPLEALARADGWRSLGLDRRRAFWAIRALGGNGEAASGRATATDMPLFSAIPPAPEHQEAAIDLPAESAGETVANDFAAIRLSLRHHPLALLREAMAARRAVPAGDLVHKANGQRITVCGLVLVRQRPGSASGVIFMTLEDETGVANVIVWPKTFERFRKVVLAARMVL